MKVGKASAIQIAFFTYALLLLSVPISSYLVRAFGVTGQAAVLMTKTTPFAALLVLWVVLPPLRHAVSKLLREPVPINRRGEVAGVALASIALAFAYTAGLALSIWVVEGPVGVDQRIYVDVDKETRSHLSAYGIVTFVLLMSVVGPVIEEIIFRGFLYRAFEARWGWFTAMILSSTLFGLYHPHFYAAFTTAIVLVCVMRRTGSLRSAIVVHMTVNLALWWPLTGQFVFPHSVPTGELQVWHFHIVCALFVVVALPSYVWASRDRYVGGSDAALQK